MYGDILTKSSALKVRTAFTSRKASQSSLQPSWLKRLPHSVLVPDWTRKQLSLQGPLVNRAAVNKVADHVADAVSKGAHIEIGGSALDAAGFYHQPTVLSGVTPEMAVSNEETFGPLAPLIEFETEDQVIALANNTEFGLAAYFQGVPCSAKVASRHGWREYREDYCS